MLKHLVGFTLALMVPVLAFAQAVAEAATTTVVNFADPAALSAIVLDAVVQKKWGVLISAAIVGTMGLMKKFIPKHTKVGTWMHSKVGGWATNFTIAGAGAVLTSLLAGQAISVQLILSAVNIALGASGLYELYGDIVNKQDIAKAQAAGEAAAKDPGPTLNG